MIWEIFFWMVIVVSYTYILGVVGYMIWEHWMMNKETDDEV